MPLYENYLDIVKKLENNEDNIINHTLIKDALKKKKADIHKYTNGSLFMLVSSKGMSGAGILASKASLRCGLGILKIGIIESLLDIFSTSVYEALKISLKEKNGHFSYKSYKEILLNVNSTNATLIGPGIGVSKDNRKIVTSLIKDSKKPLVLDADAINVIKDNPDILKKATSPIILTPHLGEFSRISKIDTKELKENGEKYALEFSKKYNVILVLKSHKTIVSTPCGMVYKNLLGNEGMAKGGCGDVLSGMIASFLSQGNDALLSCLCGVYLHSLCSDLAKLDIGEYSLLPSDIIDYIKYAIMFSQKREEN